MLLLILIPGVYPMMQTHASAEVEAAALLLLAGHGSQLPALSYCPAAHAWQVLALAA